MAEMYRTPKAVLAETDLPAQMTATEVIALRSVGGAAGEWAERVTSGLRTRAAVVEEIDMTQPDVQVRGDLSQKILAAIAALGEIAEELGLVPDDEESETEEPGESAEVEEYAADPDVEARRSLIEAAEKRTYDAELRAETAEDGTVSVRGYAAMWDKEADGLPFREVIKRGAFKRSLDRGDDVFLLINHDTDMIPLARRSAGTLALEEDEVGLRFEAQLDPSNPVAASLLSALRRGDIDKCSFAFRVAENGSRKNGDGVRELRDLDLFECSIVSWPAYSATTVGLREAEADDLPLRWKRAALRLRQQSL